MGLYIIRGFFIILSSLTGLYCYPDVKLIGATIGFLGSLLVIGLEIFLGKIPIKKLILAICGLIGGLLAAILIANFFLLLPFGDPTKEGLIRIGIYFALSYLGIMIGIRGVEKLGFIVPYLHELKEEEKNVLVDTSVLIDGRVYDLAKSGFLEYTIIIPNFVIKELHGLADCASDLKRQKGRRGLETLNKLRKDESLDVKIYDMDFPDIEEVDTKLVKLASQLRAKMLTNDFNLMKVAEVQNIKVLNINSLATLMKPKLAAGEEISLKILKEGKEAGQGVGYLEDGTMVVIENGATHIGQIMEVIIDSTIQTSTGRIIFAKLKH